MMFDEIKVEDIRLIIWDMDDTFYEGSVTEGTINYNAQNSVLIKKLVGLGVQNSICSKNHERDVRVLLQEKGIWELFVFPKINFLPKSQNVKAILDATNLRPKNVLFVDDKISNLNEVKFYVPGIAVSNPSIIEVLIDYTNNHDATDLQHEKLAEFKILETKSNAQQVCETNEEFLKQSHIEVSIHSDCQQYTDRLYELSIKTSQLNFTKRRVSKEDFIDMLRVEEPNVFFVRAKDIYGNYGIIGFYSLVDGQLLDFFFSCRVLGMGIEQFIYSLLGFPIISIIEPVSVALNSNICPSWIHLSANRIAYTKIDTQNKPSILLRGECDMKQVENYLKQNANIFGEYDSRIGELQMYNMHTVLLNQKITCDPELIDLIISETFFYNSKTFDFKILSNQYDIVFMSLSSDIRQGLYRHKINGTIVVAGDSCIPIDNMDSIDQISKHSRIPFCAETLERFIDNYEFVGTISMSELVENLLNLREILPKSTKLFLFKYVPFFLTQDVHYAERNVEIEKCNCAIDIVCEKHPLNTFKIDLKTILSGEEFFAGDTLHFKRIIYYHIALEIAEILAKQFSSPLKYNFYSLPHISPEDQKAVYALFDEYDFAIIGYSVQSIELAKALRKKCIYVVDLSCPICNVNVERVVSVEHYLSDSSDRIGALVHCSAINTDQFRKIQFTKKLKEGKDMFVFGT